MRWEWKFSMRRYLKKLIKSLINLFPLTDRVIFESVPDFEGNSKALFDEMIKAEYNQRYKFIWLVENVKEFQHIGIPNVSFQKKPSNLFTKINYIITCGRVKFKITENMCYPKIHVSTIALHLGHGAPIKNTRNWMHIDGAADFALYLSEPMKENTRELYNLKEHQMICCGFPRNDILFENKEIESEEKYLVWLPTFRENKIGDRIDSNYTFPFGVPIFQKKQELIYINNMLSMKNMFIYIKPHYAANINKFNDINLSHIKIINEDFYQQRKQSFYEFLGQSQALITDYSSVFFDYLLLDKPIAITLDDYEEYKNGVGLIIKDFKEVVHAQKVYNFRELGEFICNILDSEILISNTNRDKLIYHKYIDNQSRNRIIDFLIKKGL